MQDCVLIDNFRHIALTFKSIASLKRYAKEHNLRVKESKNMTMLRSFYTEGC